MTRRKHLQPPLTDGSDPDLALAIGEKPVPKTPFPELVNAKIPHLGHMRAMARTLVLESRAAQEVADWPRWHDAVLALIGQADQLLRGRTEIENLLALSALQMASDEVCDVVRRNPCPLTDTILASLQERMVAVNNANRFRVRIEFTERVAQDFWDHIYEGSGREAAITTEGGIRLSELAGTLVESMEKGRESDSDPKNVRSMIQRLNDVVGTRGEIEDKHAEIMAKCRECHAKRLWDLPCELDFDLDRLQDQIKYLPAGLFVPGVQRFVLAEAQAELERAAAVIALACTRFHKASGRWPENLDGLVPAFLPAIPLDEYDGRPVLYRLVDGKPLVYARGVDRDDDGGKPMTATNTPFPFERWISRPPPQRPDGDFELWAVVEP